MESQTKNKKTHEQIAQMVKRAFNGLALDSAPGGITELKEGWFNVAYAVRLANGREVILKIAPPPQAEVMTYEKNMMATEVAMMRLVAQNPAVPVPQIYYFDTQQDLCDAPYFFMEKLEGENLEHAINFLSPEVKTQINYQIGGIIREINRFTGSFFGYEGHSGLQGAKWRETFIKIVNSVLEDGVRKSADYGFEVDQIQAAVLKHASTLEAVTTPHLVHWDAWNPNFFVKQGQVTGILDFERALWADPLMEAQFRALEFHGVSDSMRGYGKTSFTFEEEQRCHLYTLHLGLVMKTECYYRHYDTDAVSQIADKLLVSALGWLEKN